MRVCFLQVRMLFGHRAGCDHVALGWNGQPWRRLDEANGHGAQGPEIGAAARAGRGHGSVGSDRQVRYTTHLIEGSQNLRQGKIT